MGTFDLLVFNVILGSFSCTCLKMACHSKTVDCRVKLCEIWNSCVVVTCIWGTFTFKYSTNYWCHLVHLSQNFMYLKKCMVVEWNRVKFETQGSCTMYTVLSLTFQVILSSFCAFVSKRLLKTASYRAKESKIWNSGVVGRCVLGTFDLLVFKIKFWGHLVHLSQNGM